MFWSFDWNDLPTIGLLVFLEGILSIDNAVVLALLASRLPRHLQRRALTYGLVGAVVFRFLALFIVTYLMRWVWIKFVGGAYLAYVALHHFIKGDSAAHQKHVSAGNFWKTVLVIELTDIAFAVDSILAAVAVSQKLWVVFTGGVLGLLLMRFAASIFMKLLRRFPAFETSAYLLVLLIGLKLILDGFHFESVNFHSSSSPAFWVFWILMLASIAYGFVGQKRPDAATLRKLEAEEKALQDIDQM